MPLGAARLLVTADDGAVSQGVDDAIGELAVLGAVTHVAVLPNYGRLAVASHLQRLGCRVGLHFNLTTGQPLSPPYAVAPLLSSAARFIEPMTYSQPADRSPGVALARYRKAMASRLRRTDVVGEMRSQLLACHRSGVRLDGWNSWHHDLDRLAYIRALTQLEPPQFWTRQTLTAIGVFSGFRYLFAEKGESVSAYSRRLRALLENAIEASRASGGTPYEVAVHPSTSRPPRDFTIYSAERIVEYRAWRRLVREGFLGRAERDGAFWLFGT